MEREELHHRPLPSPHYQGLSCVLAESSPVEEMESSEGLATLVVWVAAGETHFFPAATRVLQQDPHDWAREEKVNEVDKNFRAH